MDVWHGPIIGQGKTNQNAAVTELEADLASWCEGDFATVIQVATPAGALTYFSAANFRMASHSSIIDKLVGPVVARSRRSIILSDGLPPRRSGGPARVLRKSGMLEG